jgi:prepilin-type N-terminal cleavage/methylation domain-containing protein
MKTRRRGYSLVEMIVVITVGTVLVGIAVTTLASVLHASRAIDDQVHRIATVRRLADQFRNDAHAAWNTQSLNAKGEEDPNGTAGRRFELAPGRQVTYEFQSNAELQCDTVERTEKVDQTVQSRESFILPKGICASCTASTEGKTTMIALVIASASQEKSLTQTQETAQTKAETKVAGPASRMSLRIEAVVAQDRRFMKTE